MDSDSSFDTAQASAIILKINCIKIIYFDDEMSDFRNH